MRSLVSALMVFIVSSCCWAADASTGGAPAVIPALTSEELDYKLGVGDVVRIDVFGEEGLSIEVQLPATGTFEYPFLGTVRANGLTVAQLQHRITQGLEGDYLVDPEVNVRVTKYRPFYVRGQVRNSGGFPYILGLTVEKAVTVAGGFTDRASLRNIFLIKENGTQEQKIKVNLDSQVSPGDTIIVEESLF